MGEERYWASRDDALVGRLLQQEVSMLRAELVLRDDAGRKHRLWMEVGIDSNRRELRICNLAGNEEEALQNRGLGTTLVNMVIPVLRERFKGFTLTGSILSLSTDTGPEDLVRRKAFWGRFGLHHGADNTVEGLREYESPSRVPSYALEAKDAVPAHRFLVGQSPLMFSSFTAAAPALSRPLTRRRDEDPAPS
ncbi:MULTISPECIES: hypothetical protein [Cupriavidus]